MSIKVGSKVNTPKGAGVVINTYDFSGIPIVIAKLEDETISKFLQEDVKEIPEVEEPVEETRDTIMITREEFRDKITKVMGELIVSKLNESPIGAVWLTSFSPVIGANLEIALFGDPENV